MTERQAAVEIERLSAEIRLHEHAYHVLSRPEISDAEFDGLFDTLVELERRHPQLAMPDSPTRRVGSDLTQDLPEVEHTVPVLSLDKAYDMAGVERWMDKARAADPGTAFVVEEKIDGSSILLHYRDGVLERAVTRGNGRSGNDVTANVRTIRTVPLRLQAAETLVVRGEIFIRRAAFEALNDGVETPYANARNFAAGSLRRVKSVDVATVPLEIFVYEGFMADPPTTHTELLAHLRRLGFRINPATVVIEDDADGSSPADGAAGFEVIDTASTVKYVEERAAARPDLPYDIDGLVLKVDRLAAREAMGATEHHPRWAIAVKFDAPEGVSVVRSIEIQVGRTGRVTPVARIDPVPIAGSTIANVTLHNQDYVDSLELAVGDTVAVSKRGDVIPAVERVLEKDPAGQPVWRMPAECPSCGSALTVQGAHSFCPNAACRDQVRGRLRFFVARDQMDIAGLGPATIDLLVDRGWVRDIAELYRFDPQRLLGEEGFGEKSVAALADGIEASKAKPFAIVLPALGLPELGPKVSDLLLQAGFRDIESLYAAVDAGDPEVFTGIDGIGERTTESIMRQLGRPDALTGSRMATWRATPRGLIAALRARGLRFAADPSDPAGTDGGGEQPFAGQTWCITGSFEAFKPRARAADEIRARGGTVTGAVSGATTHLLAGSGGGSKVIRAEEAGVEIVDEQAFLSLLRRSPDPPA
ncbi:MAG: NAD-dependent DNA ligase LigA [Spirochaetaceae bacterium]|nr:NAD-dependent DNA ligase LigA [Spirochaetaceae bacterium]